MGQNNLNTSHVAAVPSKLLHVVWRLVQHLMCSAACSHVRGPFAYLLCCVLQQQSADQLIATFAFPPCQGHNYGLTHTDRLQLGKNGKLPKGWVSDYNLLLHDNVTSAFHTCRIACWEGHNACLQIGHATLAASVDDRGLRDQR